MKNLTPLVIVILALTACGQRAEKEFADSLEAMNLKGNVKSSLAISSRYDITTDSLFVIDESTRGFRSEAYYFNEHRMMTKSEMGVGYQAAHKITTDYVYDSDNDLIEQTTITPHSHTTIKLERKNGRIVEQKAYDKDGELTMIVKYEKQPDGSTKMVGSAPKSDIIQFIQTETKSEDGTKTVESTHFDEFGEYEMAHSITIYKNGLQIEIFDKLQNNSIKNEYDDRGNMIKTMNISNGKVENEAYMEYEYDEKGNWIRQIFYEKSTNRPVVLNERTIEYYE